MLNNAEKRYTVVTKIGLSLYFACTNLRHYLLLAVILMICKTDAIKYMLTRPIVKGRVAKWSFALSELDLVYVPMKAVKGQVITNFLAEYPCVQVERFGSESYAQLVPWLLYFDGSFTSIVSGVGILIVSARGHK